MIKVNLKNENTSTTNPKGVVESLKYFQNISFSKKSLNATFFVLSMVFVALGAIPHLFFMQFSDYMSRTHKKALTSLAEEEEALKAELSRYQNYQTEMKSIEDQQSKVMEKLTVLRKLQTSRVGAVNILDTIGQSLPSRVWLNSLDLNLGTNPKAQVNGKGYSSDDVSDFADKLSGSIYFDKVSLENVTTQKESESLGTIKAFTVLATPKLESSEIRGVAQENKGSAKN